MVSDPKVGVGGFHTVFAVYWHGVHLPHHDGGQKGAQGNL
jgi:hypothetical protein